EGSSCLTQNGCATSAFSQFVCPKHSKFRVGSELHAETGFDSVCCDVAGAVSRGTHAALSPLCDQRKESRFSFVFIREILDRAQRIRGIARRQSYKGFTNPIQSLQIVRETRKRVGRDGVAGILSRDGLFRRCDLNWRWECR